MVIEDKFLSFVKNSIRMEEDKFRLLGQLLEEEKVYMDPALTFEQLCCWIGVERREMNIFLTSVVGYEGNDILKAYRDSSALYFMEKYGIKL